MNEAGKTILRLRQEKRELALMLKELLERAHMTYPHFESGPGADLLKRADNLLYKNNS